ncbi:MAG: response regulator [Dehalococcoidia bacterium]|nr:response regulator [Dehalococcoidia bacterium]
METTKKILIVDDEPDFLLALQRTLEAKLYQVATASNRAEVQESIKTIDPDVIILGTMTPRGEAFSLHQWLRQHPKTKDLPVLVIDAAPEKQLIKGWRRDEAMVMEAEDYIAKPIEPASMAVRTQAVLERAAKRIKVLIVDDHSVVRDGIRAVLTLQKDIEVVGEAVNGKDAVEKVRQLLPDVVIMDIVMPEMDGLEATKRIYKEYPQTKVLMLSQYDDEENILAAEQLGAYGFIPKRAASSQLINGIKAIYYMGEHLQRPATASD